LEEVSLDLEKGKGLEMPLGCWNNIRTNFEHRWGTVSLLHRMLAAI